MILNYVARNQLNEELYNKCIAASVQKRVYAYSWYLDIAAVNWKVLVLDDYKAVMPLPFRKKNRVNYIYMPFWMTQLGIFSNQQDNTEEIIMLFINEMKKQFRYADLRLNTENYMPTLNLSMANLNINCELDINCEYDVLYNKYRKDRKKDLRKAKKHLLYLNNETATDNLIPLIRNNVGRRIKKIDEKAYMALDRLITICLQKGKGEILSVFEGDKVVASAFLVISSNRVTILVSSTNFANRSNGANTFLIDEMIRKYANKGFLFDFGGSSIPSIANYFRSFGAEEKKYYFINHNQLPFPIKILKKVKNKFGE